MKLSIYVMRSVVSLRMHTHCFGARQHNTQLEFFHVLGSPLQVVSEPLQ